jgi:hypothetical protein
MLNHSMLSGPPALEPIYSEPFQSKRQEVEIQWSKRGEISQKIHKKLSETLLLQKHTVPTYCCSKKPKPK